MKIAARISPNRPASYKKSGAAEAQHAGALPNQRVHRQRDYLDENIGDLRHYAD